MDVDREDSEDRVYSSSSGESLTDVSMDGSFIVFEEDGQREMILAPRRDVRSSLDQIRVYELGQASPD